MKNIEDYSRRLTANGLNVLDVGSGGRPVPGADTLDRLERFSPDYLIDLSNPSMRSIPQDTYRLVVLRDVVEHLSTNSTYLDQFMSELERVTTDRGEVYIRVPHYTSPEAAGDWQHTRNGFSSEFHLDYIDTGFEVSEVRLSFAKRKMLPWNYVVEPLANMSPWFYEHTPFSVFPAKNIEIMLSKRV